MRILTFKKVYLIHGKQRLEWPGFSPRMPGRHIELFEVPQLSSEILDYKLILFRSGQFDHDMEKNITVIGMF